MKYLGTYWYKTMHTNGLFPCRFVKKSHLLCYKKLKRTVQDEASKEAILNN